MPSVGNPDVAAPSYAFGSRAIGDRTQVPVLLADRSGVSTLPRALERRLDIGTAWSVVQGWLSRPNVSTPAPTDGHADLLGQLLISGRAAANHTTDAHLAALAIEWGLVLVSADRDFARYPGLRWHDASEGW